MRLSETCPLGDAARRGAASSSVQRRDRSASASVHGSKGEAISRQSLPFVILTRAGRPSDAFVRDARREKSLVSRYLNKRTVNFARKKARDCSADATIPSLESRTRFDDLQRNGTDGIVVVPEKRTPQVTS